MSIIPAKRSLKFYEGSTFDSTLTFYTDAAQTTLKDLTGYTAALMVRKDFDTATAILSLTDGGSAPPASDTLVLGGVAGTVRVYVRDETMAAMDAADWTAATQADGSITYGAVWDLELTNAAGETFRYVMGTVAFSREVTHA